MIHFALISLTTPLMIGGAALVMLPIIAHLLNRHSRRIIVFPTIALLQASAANQSKLFKLRRGMLLALRCLLVLLLVLAFSRPVYFQSETSAAAVGETHAVVLLIDTSLSTRQQRGGVQLVESLKASANRAIESLSRGRDVANVILVAREPLAIFPRLSYNFDGLRSKMATVEATYQRADFVRALTMAGQQLDKHSGPRRIVIVSDMQKTNWQEIVEDDILSDLLPEGTEVSLIEPTEDVPDNIGLSKPRTIPAVPIIGQPLQLVVNATNFAQVKKEVPVEVFVNGASVGSQTVSFDASEQKEVAFEMTISSGGLGEVVFSTIADGLNEDNKCYLAIRPTKRLPIFVVSDEPASELGSGTFFLLRALAPHDGELDRFDVQHISAKELGSVELSAAAAVFVGYVGRMPQASAEALVKYIGGGGGVVFFSGEGAVDENLKVVEAAAGENGILPWQPGRSRNLALLDESLTIQSGQWNAQLLRQFDQRSQVAMGEIQFSRVWAVGAIHPETHVLLQFSDRSPALATRSFGTGRLVVANFSPSVDSSDLGKYGTFVALVQILAKELRTTAGLEPENHVGSSVEYSDSLIGLSTADKITATDPEGQPLVVMTGTQNDRLQAQIFRTLRPGFHRLLANGKPTDVAAVNVEGREGDLQRFSKEQLQKSFSHSGGVVDVHQVTDGNVKMRPNGRPMWGWLMWLAMLVIGVELALLGIWRR
jgi:hypothetical protein